jgi:hypothetical protein
MTRTFEQLSVGHRTDDAPSLGESIVAGRVIFIDRQETLAGAD